MRIEKCVSFDGVREAFERQSDYGTNGWAREVIALADKEYSHWVLATLDLDDILGVMLPHHTHGAEVSDQLVPQSCSTVSQAIDKLESIPSDAPCRKKIESISAEPSTQLFLSMGPISSSNCWALDYRALVDKGYKGLTHLDGLHRLVAWGRSRNSGATAYVAGCDGVFHAGPRVCSAAPTQPLSK